MPLLDQIRESKLIELAKAHFDPKLKPAELKVLHDSASSKALPEPDEKAPRFEVRADFLRWLVTDPDIAPQIDPKGLRVYGAIVPNKLDLRQCRTDLTLDFQRCDFQREIDLQSSETRGLFLFDSSLAEGISGDRAVVRGPLLLRNVHSKGEIRLLGARIERNLSCNGAKLRAKGEALSADGAHIGGAVFLTGGFESDGAIRLPGAEIAGQFNCSGAKLKAKGYGLLADHARIGNNVLLNDGFESEGEISLQGVEIAGQLVCSGAKLWAVGDALSADGAKIGGDVFLDDGFESHGRIRLLGAVIGGNLVLRGAKVDGVICQNAVITGDLVWHRVMIWNRVGKFEEIALNLAGAKVKNLRDDQISWPKKGKLNIDGLVYEELTLHDFSSDENIKYGTYSSELPLIVEKRIDWITRQSNEICTEPQPWMQLRDLLERKGDRRGAKYVLFRFRCLQARAKSRKAEEWIRRHLQRFTWAATPVIFIGILFLLLWDELCAVRCFGQSYFGDRRNRRYAFYLLSGTHFLHGSKRRPSGLPI